MAARSSLSVAARALRTHLAAAVGLPESQILIGHPSLAAKDVEGDTNKQFLNLFFYRVEHGAHPPDGAVNDPFFLRVYCLITALGTKETAGDGATISAGENDLRLVGGVLRRLHESPILRLQDNGSQDVAQLQVLLHTLSLDDLNHIWSTQGDTPYRLSIGYELALVPMPLGEAARRGPRVGAIGIGAQSDIGYRPLPGAGFGTGAKAPQVPALHVDSDRPDWVPHICWYADDGTLQYSAAVAADNLPAALQVIALGKPADSVDLFWEVWNPALPDPRWQIAAAEPANLTLPADRLDPRQTAPALNTLAQDVDLPLTLPGQALLYARRNYTRPDGTVVALVSNPLLVSIYEEAAA